MGSFYVSLCISDLPLEPLKQWLDQIEDHFLIGPQAGPWICVVSALLDTQDFALLDAFGKGATKDSNRKAFAVLNHDDDVLSVDVYVNGEMVAAYNSCPGYFLEEPAEGQLDPRLQNPEAYAALKEGVTAPQVVAILQPSEGFVFASDAHGELVDLLGLPAYSKGIGFKYALDGDTDVEWITAGAKVVQV